MGESPISKPTQQQMVLKADAAEAAGCSLKSSLADSFSSDPSFIATAKFC